MLSEFKDAKGNIVRRVRMVERLDAVQPIRDQRTGAVYKVVKRDGNHRAELWRLPDGTPKLEVISTFRAAQEAEARRKGQTLEAARPHPAAKLIMRLHKNAVVALGVGDARQVMRVVKMREGQVTLAGGNLKKRDADKSDPFKYVSVGASRLKAEQAQKLWVTPAGRVRAGSARFV